MSEPAIVNCASGNHAANAERGDRSGPSTRMLVAIPDIAFEEANHGSKNLLKCQSQLPTSPRNIVGKSHHRTRLVDIFKMLAGQISADHLWSNQCGVHIDFNALPRILPVWVGEETREYLDIQIALAFEVTVKSAAR